MDERILTMAEKIKEQWPTLFNASAQHLAKHLDDAGYRLDPYPNGKSKGELIARIEAVEAERDKTRNLLRDEHQKASGYFKQHLASEPNCHVCAFLAETSSVKL